jgi:hypothetical protein
MGPFEEGFFVIFLLWTNLPLSIRTPRLLIYEYEKSGKSDSRGAFGGENQKYHYVFTIYLRFSFETLETCLTRLLTLLIEDWGTLPKKGPF